MNLARAEPAGGDDPKPPRHIPTAPSGAPPAVLGKSARIIVGLGTRVNYFFSIELLEDERIYFRDRAVEFTVDAPGCKGVYHGADGIFQIRARCEAVDKIPARQIEMRLLFGDISVKQLPVVEEPRDPVALRKMLERSPTIEAQIRWKVEADGVEPKVETATFLVARAGVTGLPWDKPSPDKPSPEKP